MPVRFGRRNLQTNSGRQKKNPSYKQFYPLIIPFSNVPSGPFRPEVGPDPPLGRNYLLVFIQLFIHRRCFAACSDEGRLSSPCRLLVIVISRSPPRTVVSARKKITFDRLIWWNISTKEVWNISTDKMVWWWCKTEAKRNHENVQTTKVNKHNFKQIQVLVPLRKWCQRRRRREKCFKNKPKVFVIKM